MNITIDNIDELNAVLKIQIMKEDYDAQVQKVLYDYRKKVNLQGFRPGKVPSSHIKKVYGKSVLVNEINKIVSESLSKYLAENKLNILGEPLPNEKEQKPIDWDYQTEFEFAFDLGIAPEFNINLTKRNKFLSYDILVDNKLIDTNIDNLAERYGTHKQVETVENSELLKGNLVQINEQGKVLEQGISVHDFLLPLRFIKDQEIKKKFTGAKKNEKPIFNPKKAYPNNAELATVLRISEKDAEKLSSDFQFTITEILKFEKAKMNQQFFDKVYGKSKVKSEKEFKNKIKEEIKQNLSRESNYKFKLDIKDKLIEKTSIQLPEEFLKRWLLVTNKSKYNEEQIEREFLLFKSSLKWQLIKNNIIINNNITVSEDEAFEYARQFALSQYRQYEITKIEAKDIEKKASEILNNEEEKRKIFEAIYEAKIFDFIKNAVKIENKQVTTEEFNELFEK